GDETGDAAGHHQCDGEGLAPQQPQVPERFSVQGFHGYQDSSAGVKRRAGISMLAMRPSASRMTRSAMPAMAALCVMTMAVVPSSRLIRAMTSSTSLPVAES